MAARLFRLRVVVAAGLMAGLLLSPKLWVGTRFYPLTPVAPFLKPLPYPFDYAVYILLLALLAGTVASALRLSSPRWWIAASVLLLAALCAQDQSRLQPWCYQYAFMLMALVVPSAETSLNVCRLIVAAIYFWSGAQKLNPYFAPGTFTWLAHPLALHFPALVIKAGYAAPFVEMACAIGLLTLKFRAPAVAVLIAMHACILLAIGPLGHGFNTVVWPWNIAMVVFLLLLFRHSETCAREILWGQARFQRVVLLLFGLAPALSFFNLWDSYLSAALYSGNKNQSAIYMTQAVADHLPDKVDDDVTEEADGIDKLSVNDWSFDELNAPAYPEVRIYENVARKLCGFAAKASDVRLEVQGKAVLANGSGKASFICSNL
ncbi:MAG: hypothetical protein ABSG03_32685 [Bryobacteraceae bacterium]